jgi:hypothetical protein
MYQTRHTFATLALQSGEQIGWVSKQLGHTSDEMVIRHYAKFIPNLTRMDGSALAKVMQEQGLAPPAPPVEAAKESTRPMGSHQPGDVRTLPRPS